MKKQIITISKEEIKQFLEINNVKTTYQTSFKYCFAIKDDNNILAVASLGIPLSTTLRDNLFGYENRNNIIQFTSLFINPGQKNLASYFISNIIKLLPFQIIIASTTTPATIFPASNFKFYGKKDHKFRYVYVKNTNLLPLFTEKILIAPKKLKPTKYGYKRCINCLKSIKIEEYPTTKIKNVIYYRNTCKDCKKIQKRKLEKKYRQTKKYKLQKNKYRKSLNYKLSCRKYYQLRKETDILFVIKRNLRGRTRSAIKQKLFIKNKNLIEYLGCTALQLRIHLQNQFKSSMNWNNYGFGRGKWNIDHIIPLSSATTVEEMYKLAHYTNLQPLWHEENQKKTNKIQ